MCVQRNDESRTYRGEIYRHKKIIFVHKSKRLFVLKLGEFLRFEFYNLLSFDHFPI